LHAVAIAVDERSGRRSAVVVDATSGDVALFATQTTDDELADQLGDHDRSHEPRWLWWGHVTALAAAHLDLRPARCWDLAAVHRLLHGGWRADPARVWAAAHELDVESIPRQQPVDLFSTLDDHDPDEPVRSDGHLDPDWAAGAWADTSARIERWARLAVDVHTRQATLARQLTTDRPQLGSTIRSESTAAALAAELEVGGLPIDLDIAEEIIGSFVGPRPANEPERMAAAHARDQLVLTHVPDGDHYDLRSPEQVKSMLRRCGIEVPDTRSWRLERLVDQHPVIQPLLAWRRAERIDTTFGYTWLDDHVAASPAAADADGRRGVLRGEWSASDGAAGRMTASAGLHNMPAELRPAVTPEPGHVFVRADLGQIEPRILAAVSGDEQLATAAQQVDMYAPVATRLRVERDVAKVAVLGAMYGQTTGIGAEALRGLEREYPVAMNYLHAADRAAQGGNDLRTVGGRLVRMSAPSGAGDPDAERSRAAARGRFGRNAMVQGAAAEFFKMWALLVRSRVDRLGGRIVLCLHDELLVQIPADAAEDGSSALDDALTEAAARWTPPGAPRVRFVTDTSVIERWSDAK